VQREAYERAIEEEAERRARVVEQTRYRFAEMMTGTYEKAIENLKRSDFWENMRPQDVIQIAKLHLETTIRLEEIPLRRMRLRRRIGRRMTTQQWIRSRARSSPREEQPPPADDPDDREEYSEESEGEQD